MIIFHTVRYKNILSTGNQWTEIALDRSKSTLIMGKNGHGKSTFIDAIAFALYGRAYRNINKPLLVNAITNKHCIVEVEFTTNGNHYLVRRGIKPAKFDILKNGVLIDRQAGADEQQLILTKEILKIDYKSFFQVIVLGSADYVPFMSLAATSRRQVIEDLLDIQVFTTMNSLLKLKIESNNSKLALAQKLIDQVKTKIQVHKTHLESQSVGTKEQITSLEDTKKEYKGRLKNSTSTARSLLHKQSKLLPLLAKQKITDKKIDEISSLQRSLQDREYQLTTDIKFYQTHDRCSTCGQTIDDHFKEKTTDKLRKKCIDIDSALEQIAIRTQALDEQHNNFVMIAESIQQINVEIAAVNQATSSMTDYIDSINNQIESLKTRSVEQKMSSSLEDDKKMLGDTEVIKKTLLTEREVLQLSSTLLKDSGIKTRIIKRYIPVINTLINKYLSSMNFSINFEIDEHFKETIRSPGRDEFTYFSFSEGQKSKIDIALLMTWRDIAKMRNSMSTNLLIMDEVFDGSLDAESNDGLIEILEKLPEDTNIFVISHKPDWLFDKFRSVISFEEIRNFSKMSIRENV